MVEAQNYYGWDNRIPLDLYVYICTAFVAL